MVKSRFLEFVHDYILKMFTGSEIVGEEETKVTKKFIDIIGNIDEEKMNANCKLTFTEKDELELTLYSDAKASGYYQCVKSLLYQYNVQLPAYNLPEIMDEISIEEFRKIFKEIYSSAKKIAGGVK